MAKLQAALSVQIAEQLQSRELPATPSTVAEDRPTNDEVTMPANFLFPKGPTSRLFTLWHFGNNAYETEDKEIISLPPLKRFRECSQKLSKESRSRLSKATVVMQEIDRISMATFGNADWNALALGAAEAKFQTCFRALKATLHDDNSNRTENAYTTIAGKIYKRNVPPPEESSPAAEAATPDIAQGGEAPNGIEPGGAN